MNTTNPAIVTTAAQSNGKFPWLVAWLMVEPRPNARNVLPLICTYSLTMVAFQAPPAAVTSPVTRYGNTQGRYSFVQRWRASIRYTLATSLRSLGIAEAPAITLN